MVLIYVCDCLVGYSLSQLVVGLVSHNVVGSSPAVSDGPGVLAHLIVGPNQGCIRRLGGGAKICYHKHTLRHARVCQFTCGFSIGGGVLPYVSMDKDMYDFDCKMLSLSQADITISQYQKVILGSVWTRECNDFDCKMLNLGQADKTISQNQTVIFRSVWTWKCKHFDSKIYV